MRRLLAHFGDSSAATDVARRSPVGWLIACGALLVAAIIVGTTLMVAQFRDRALADAERELENTVLLLTRHFDQQFEDSNTIARSVIVQMGIPQMTSPDEFRQKMSSIEAHELLKSRVSALSFICSHSSSTSRANFSMPSSWTRILIRAL